MTAKFLPYFAFLLWTHGMGNTGPAYTPCITIALGRREGARRNAGLWAECRHEAPSWSSSTAQETPQSLSFLTCPVSRMG